MAVSLLLATACGSPQRPADDQLVDATLAGCHQLLRGRLDRISADVTLPTGERVRCAAQLPDRLRTASSDGVFVLVGDTAVRVRDDVRTAATAAERLHLSLLRTLLDAVTLGPLHRARGCAGRDDGTFAIDVGAAQPWTLQLGTPWPGSTVARPVSLAGPLGCVRLLDYRQTTKTPPTWVVSRAELAGLGACDVTFELADITWDPETWNTATGDGRAPAPATATPVSPSLKRPIVAVESRSSVPIAVTTRAVRWVVLPDPGDWAARTLAYTPVYDELQRQDQQIAGFCGLAREGERDLLVVPFRQRNGGKPLATPDGWQVREVPAGTALVVYPDQGDLAQRRARGEDLLRRDLAEQGVTAVGPIVTQPFFHLHEGPPTAEQLAAPVVRISVLVP